MKRYLVILLLSLGGGYGVWGQTFISPADPAIILEGALFNEMTDTLVVFRRHSEDFLSLPMSVSMVNPDKACTTSGVTITFRTEARTVRTRFRMLPGHNLWMLWFTLYVDGDSVTALTKRRDGLTSAGDSLFAFDLPVPAARGEHTYRLVLPVLSTPAFAGITLEGGRETLVKIPKQERPLYIAYGNSITHGQGQFTGDQTWPWVLAQQMGWQLCNLAVGGSKTSVPMAEMIARQIMQHVDYMTILIGFNDAVFLRLDTATYRKRLTDFIRTVRKGHPETEIFLLGQTYTEKKEDKEGEPLNFGDWRKVQCEVAEAFMAAGDRKVHYLNGALYTRHEDLKNPPRDVVHLNVRGAYHFGTALADTIRKILMR